MAPLVPTGGRMDSGAGKGRRLGERTGETPEDLCVLFGANLRQARLRAGLTQAQVAKLTGMQAHYVSTIENGLQNPTLSTMVRVARAVGTDPRTLLKRPSRPI